MAKRFLAEIVQQARAGKLMSDDHFTVDGTLIEAWASIKRFRRKDEKPEDREPPDDPGNPTVNFHGEKRSIFGWAKSVACFRKTRFKGLTRTQLAAHFVAAAYHLLRLSRLLPT